MAPSQSQNTNVANDITALFSSATDGEEDGELFRDKVRALFEHFDTDQDDHLKFAELAALQRATAGTTLTEEMYVMACKALDCKPGTGISLNALKLTYAADGSNIDKDYYSVFPERDPKKKDIPKKNQKEEEDVYEVGADGSIDIS